MDQVAIQGKWITAEQATFSESIIESTDNTKERKLVLSAKIVPFNTISRNGVLYNKKRIEATHTMLIGKPLMHNHVLEGVDVLPRGEWLTTEIRDDGLYGTAEIYDVDYNTNLISFLQKCSSPKVSLQITGDAKQRKDESGAYYQEAMIDDWLEVSIVNVPGFNEAKGSLSQLMSESFGNVKVTNTDEEFFTEVTELIDEERFFAELLAKRGNA